MSGWRVWNTVAGPRLPTSSSTCSQCRASTIMKSQGVASLAAGLRHTHRRPASLAWSASPGRVRMCRSFVVTTHPRAATMGIQSGSSFGTTSIAGARRPTMTSRRSRISAIPSPLRSSSTKNRASSRLGGLTRHRPAACQLWNARPRCVSSTPVGTGHAVFWRVLAKRAATRVRWKVGLARRSPVKRTPLARQS